MAGEHFDFSSTPDIASGSIGKSDAQAGRPFVGIHFACCQVYTRIYVNRAETAYVGFCPKCGRRARLRVGPGGTETRIFTAS